MFARCARVAPAVMRACCPSYLMASFFSCCSTVMPLATASDSSPLAPLTLTTLAATEAVTPVGSSTGRFATRLICFSLGHDAEHFAALPDGPRLFVGHHALGRGDDGGTQTALDLRQLALAAVDTQSGTRHALQAVDDRAPVEVLQLDAQRRLRAVVHDVEAGHVAFVPQHLDQRLLQFRRGHRHFRLARQLRVADAGQEIGNGISHAHATLSLPARLGHAGEFPARHGFANLHARQAEAAIDAPGAPSNGASVTSAARARVARQLLQLHLCVGTNIRRGLRAANELFQLSTLRRVFLHDLRATLLALDHVCLGHTLWFLTCGTGN